MAKWIVIVVLLAQNVFAAIEKNSLCDTCIRGGSTWCHKNIPQLGNCITISTDGGCPSKYTERLNDISSTSNKSGSFLNPLEAERTLYLSDTEGRIMEVTYASPVRRQVKIEYLPVLNKPVKIDVTEKNTICDATKCTIEILAIPAASFCSFYEFIDVKISVENSTEETKIRYHVPCSCPCTSQTQEMSQHCSFKGNYTCGICDCQYGWHGDTCSESCYRGGDLIGETEIRKNMCFSIRNNKTVECNNNGKCACSICKCFENQPGSQYLDPMEQCADICMQILDCSACLRKGTIGDCPSECQQDLTVVPLNKTIVTDERDEEGRKPWVHCKDHVDECSYDYYAKKTDEKYYAMVNISCSIAVQGGHVSEATSTKVPLIIGLVFLILAIATVGGILLWKHMNALPALPTNDPQYANIDAEDSRGENPLYKPPTSSFKNPTYGKW